VDREAILRDAAEEHLLREASRRRFLYSDVEELIENRFLIHTMVLNGLPITFRSMLPQDLLRFRARAARKTSALSILRWSVAASIWIIDGFEVSLDPADNGAYHIYKTWVEDLPNSVVEALSVNVIAFQNRISRAVRITESYCYEPYSRGLWRMKGRPTDGLDNANIVRRLWVAHNLAEDDSKQVDKDWAQTRAIVGSMTNKGAKHLSQALQKSQEREEQRRQRVIETAVNWIIQGELEGQQQLTVTINGKQVVVPKVHSAQTTRDLEEEMRKVFTGEKDYHDVMVDQYQQGIKERVEQKRKESQIALAEARKRYDEAEEKGTPLLQGYTREQLAQLNPEMVKPRTTESVPESARSSYMYQRYISPTLKAGVLTPGLKIQDSDRADLEARTTETKEEPPGTETLQQKIAKRKLTMKGD